MPYDRPSLQLLIDRSKADIEFVLQNGGAFELRTFEAASARAVGGAANELHGHIANAQKQSLASTADEKELVQMAGERGVERNPATRAILTLEVVGTIGSTPIPIGTQFSRPDGTVYETIDPFSIPVVPPLEVSITARAIETGAFANTPPTTTLTLTSAIPGVNSAATVEGTGSTPVGDGTDIENLEVFRARFIRFLQSPPKGGAAGDYVTFALSVPGITRAFELVNQLGPGTVVVIVVTDIFDAEGLFVETVVPGAAKLLELATFINARKPVVVNSYITDAEAYRGPTTPFPTINPNILISPDSTELREAVSREIQDLLLREAVVGGTLPLSKIRAAVSNTAGILDSIVVSPVADVSVGPLELLTIGTPVYGPIP